MKTFVIQSKNADGYIIPAQSYGYTAIEAIEYANWFNREQTYKYVLSSNLSFKSPEAGEPEAICYNYLKRDCIPIGSVEYVLEWLKLMGVPDIKPLNIPEELWKFCDREIKYVDNLIGLNGEWMVKDRNRIKSSQNEALRLPQNKQGDYFVTQWIDNVVSEWRVFVLDKEIKGIRCYSGDEWVMPSEDYIQNVIDSYDKKIYTLDVMVYDDKKCPIGTVDDVLIYRTKRKTEIIELHDFFACGLYGFEDYTTLLRMWITTINELLPAKRV